MESIHENSLEGRQEESQFKPEEALEEENTLLEKFRGKVGRIGAIFTLASSLSFLPGFTEEAYGGEQPTKGKLIEMHRHDPEVREAIETTIKFIHYLANLPDNPTALSQAHQEGSKQRVAEVFLYRYAQRKVGGEGSRVTRQDMKEAAKELDDRIGYYADRYFGNNDGRIETEEVLKFQNEGGKNPGLRALIEFINHLLYR